MENQSKEEDLAAAEVLVMMRETTLEEEETIRLEKTLGKTPIYTYSWCCGEETVIVSIDGSKLPRYPPIPSLEGKINLRACSVPFEKQLSPTDVNNNQQRLLLSKKEVVSSILPLLESHEDPSQGIVVTTYNPEGKAYEMTFKSWTNSRSYVLNEGWTEFYKENGLRMYMDFVTVWMFRHSQTRKLCFALTWKTMPHIQFPWPN